MTGILFTLLLLILAFCLKVYLNRTPSLVDYLKACCELPVDIMFMNIAFIISYRIAQTNIWIKNKATITEEMNGNFSYFVIYLVMTIGVIVLWRYADKSLNEQKLKKFTIFTIISYIIALGAMFFALVKLYGVI